MRYQIVTIARTLGAGGEDVGQAVAQQLGFRYADDEIIAAAAEKAGVEKSAIERAERRPSLVARILDSMATLPVEPSMYYGQVLAAPTAADVPVGYDELIRDVIVGTANLGNAVIVAHGSGICLGGMEGVLRVLVTASPDVRAARVAKANSIDIEKARKAVVESDRDRQDFLRRFYKVRDEAPIHYDLTISTDALTPADAGQIVAGAARL
jgi:cytidylate kinase